MLIFILGIILIIILLISTKEEFVNMQIQTKEQDPPLLLNMYPKIVPNDMKLLEFINKERFYNYYSYKDPVIFIPGAGSSKIFGTWDFVNSGNTKSLDAYSKGSNWACKPIQEKNTELWYPNNIAKLSMYCWNDNIKISHTEGHLLNKDGVDTFVSGVDTDDFQGTHLNNFMNAIKYNGYKLGSNLFIAHYDFRLIADDVYFEKYANSLSIMIEEILKKLHKKVIIIGHSLGSLVANRFIVSKNISWRLEYINKFISISGAFGGCPKALRVGISGEEIGKEQMDSTELNVMNDAIKNFSGLHLMMPYNLIYNEPIIKYNQSLYSGKDIPTLLKIANNNMNSEIYELSLKFHTAALNDPMLNVYILYGSGIQTEQTFDYKNNINKTPDKIKYTNGDGTMPLNMLELPIKRWTNSKIKFKSYDNCEHLNIMNSYDMIKDIVDIINGLH